MSTTVLLLLIGLTLTAGAIIIIDDWRGNVIALTPPWRVR